MDLRSNFRVRRGVIVPVSRAGEDGVGWREVVEVEVFVVVGGAGGLCHWEGVGVVVFASMSMVVVVVVQRTKWSVLLLLFRFLVESLSGISVYVSISSLLFPLLLPSLPPSPYTKAQGKKKARRSSVKKKCKTVKSSISRPYTDPLDTKKKQVSQVYIQYQQYQSRG